MEPGVCNYGASSPAPKFFFFKANNVRDCEDNSVKQRNRLVFGHHEVHVAVTVDCQKLVFIILERTALSQYGPMCGQDPPSVSPSWVQCQDGPHLKKKKKKKVFVPVILTANCFTVVGTITVYRKTDCRLEAGSSSFLLLYHRLKEILDYKRKTQNLKALNTSQISLTSSKGTPTQDAM